MKTENKFIKNAAFVDKDGLAKMLTIAISDSFKHECLHSVLRDIFGKNANLKERAIYKIHNQLDYLALEAAHISVDLIFGGDE